MKRLIYLKNWQSLDLLVSPVKKLSLHDFYNLRHTSIVTSRHSLMIAVTVRAQALDVQWIKCRVNVEKKYSVTIITVTLFFFPHWPYILFIERRVPVVRVNNHCPAFLKLVAIYSWLPNNCLCIEQCSSQQCEKNVFDI